MPILIIIGSSPIFYGTGRGKGSGLSA
ncbi:hypothetical protein HKBW3S47_01978, partial [Candidatus Hakubella thermalkaliphila]